VVTVPHRHHSARPLILWRVVRPRQCSGMSPDGPDFNPIENAFAKLKALLREAAERTREGLWNTIGRLPDLFTPQECKNYFKAAGYDATDRMALW
jgi:hypothetical protein